MEAAVEAPVELSFASYVRSRSNGLLRVAWLITRSWEDAHDAVQDAFTALYARWSRLPEGGRLDAYVYRSVVNACLSVVRRRRADPVGDISVLREAPTVPDQTTPFLEADALWRLCGELPALQRTAVVLRFYQDMSYSEVAAAMGCRESTARSHVHRAVLALRSRLEQEQA